MALNLTVHIPPRTRNAARKTTSANKLAMTEKKSGNQLQGIEEDLQ